MSWDDDEYDDDPDPECCEHAEYEIDILSGRASCYRCGESWPATDDQIRAEADHQAHYLEDCQRQEFRERWLWWWDRSRFAVRRWFERRRRPTLTLDDELPF